MRRCPRRVPPPSSALVGFRFPQRFTPLLVDAATKRCRSELVSSWWGACESSLRRLKSGSSPISVAAPGTRHNMAAAILAPMATSLRRRWSSKRQPSRSHGHHAQPHAHHGCGDPHSASPDRLGVMRVGIRLRGPRWVTATALSTLRGSVDFSGARTRWDDASRRCVHPPRRDHHHGDCRSGDAVHRGCHSLRNCCSHCRSY